MEPVARCFPSTESSTAAWRKEKSAKRVERSRRTGISELNIQKLRDPQNLKPDMGARQAIWLVVTGTMEFYDFPIHVGNGKSSQKRGIRQPPTSYLLLWIGGFSDFVESRNPRNLGSQPLVLPAPKGMWIASFLGYILRGSCSRHPRMGDHGDVLVRNGSIKNGRSTAAEMSEDHHKWISPSKMVF